MVTNPISVDETRSLAYRENGQVHLVVHLTDPDVVPGDVVARFRHDQRKFKKPARVTAVEGGGATLELSVPAGRLGRVPWFLAVQQADGGPFVRVQTRVLSHPDLPVALLPGPPPRTRMPAPDPRANPAAESARGLLRQGRRVAGGLKRRLRERSGA